MVTGLGDASGATIYWYKIRKEVRAIEREAYKQGQAVMLLKALENTCTLCSDAIRNLEIEEPK